ALACLSRHFSRDRAFRMASEERPGRGAVVWAGVGGAAGVAVAALNNVIAVNHVTDDLFSSKAALEPIPLPGAELYCCQKIELPFPDAEILTRLITETP